jgi:hypothetical protein
MILVPLRNLRSRPAVDRGREDGAGEVEVVQAGQSGGVTVEPCPSSPAARPAPARRSFGEDAFTGYAGYGRGLTSYLGSLSLSRRTRHPIPKDIDHLDEVTMMTDLQSSP